MKICAVSDLHGQLIDIPSCDLFLIAGDVCPVYNHRIRFQAKWLNSEFRRWLDDVPATHIVATWGNHDLIGEDKPELVPKLRWHLLVDKEIELAGLKIYGSPYQKRFFDWGFNLDEPDLAKKWNLIPSKTDILVLHSPPYGIGDFVPPNVYHDGEHTGSPSLLQRIKEIKPKLSVWGHIHEAHGVYDIDGCIGANVSILNDNYKAIYKPTMFELSDSKINIL